VTAADRIAAAVPLAAELRDLVLREAERGLGAAWNGRLVQLLDILGTDDDPDEVLTYAALTFDQLYRGPRNFGEFMIYRPDQQEQIAANEHRIRLTGELRDLLHGA
jgi:hypothetical protein